MSAKRKFENAVRFGLTLEHEEMEMVWKLQTIFANQAGAYAAQSDVIRKAVRELYASVTRQMSVQENMR